MRTIAIIVAGGSGARFGSQTPKQFLKIAGKPLLAHTIQRFEDTHEIDEIIIVVAEEFVEFTREEIVETYCFGKVSRVVLGGASRLESTRNALVDLPEQFDLIAIHDGARPLVAPSDISRVIKAASKSKSAVLVSPVSDTVKLVRNGKIVETLNRRELFGASTPQVFDRKLLIKAHDSFSSQKSATDDSFILESAGIHPDAIIAEYPNPKVTTPVDLELAQVLLKNEMKQSKPITPSQATGKES